MTNDSGDIFVGIVTALDADFGFIDGTIFFTKVRFSLFPFWKKQRFRQVSLWESNTAHAKRFRSIYC